MPEREVKFYRVNEQDDEIVLFIPKDTAGYSAYGFHLYLTEEECVQLGKIAMDMGTSKLSMLMMKLRTLTSFSNNLKGKKDAKI